MVDLYEQYENIYNEKTKNYFEEVLSSYNNKNYRSAVVMLYSVVIYDIIAKIKELDEIYNQEWAKKTIKEINTLRKTAPKSPEWEKLLLEKIKQQNDFLSLSIVEEVRHLREIRNQCAHPAMDNNDELFTPSRYEADALIYRMLKDILTIPAMFTNKITDYITEQISKIAGYSEFKWKDKNQLSKSFLKYFKRMNDTVFVKVFKDMWKLTFYTSNEKCDENRFINMIFIDIMLRERHTVLIDAMQSEKEYYNKISSDAKVNKYLSILIYRNNYLLSFLDDTTKSFIKNSRYEMPDVRLFAWFAFDTKEEYIDNLFKEHAPQKFSNIILDIYKHAPELFEVKEYFKKSIMKYYTDSASFNDADKNFNDLIYPLSHEFTKAEVLKIIENSESNVQLTRRYEYITSDDRGRKLKELVDGVKITFEEISQYKNFAKFYKSYDETNNSLPADIDEDTLPF
ncbi:MAG: hypothetical protein J6A98_02960 [Clostridia bacterium]|nr:hypothetical protein [Clostridia bacterium]